MKKYTKEEVEQLTTNGYIFVHPKLWCYIPTGAHIRYTLMGDGPAHERFRPGGFVKNQFKSGDRQMFTLENRYGGKVGEPGYVSFPVAYSDVETIWKKFDRSAFVEIYLIYNSLTQKKQQIESLTKTVSEQEARIERLENILRSLVRK